VNTLNYNKSYEEQISTTIAVFLHLIRTDIDTPHPAMDSVNWEQLLALAYAHRLLPLVQSRLSQLQWLGVPQDLKIVLSEQRDQERRKVLSLTFELVRVIDILRKHNIVVVPYKGPVLALVAYGNLTLRSFNDLDILIREEDFFKPIEILKKEGYKPLSYLTFLPDGERKLRHYYGEYTVFRGTGGVCIDIHRRCLGDGNLTLYPDLSRVWERLIPITIAGRELLTFSHTDLLMYLCLNGFKDGWDSLRGLCDMTELLRRQSEIDWQTLVVEAERLRISRILWSSLLLIHQLLDAPVPDWILENARSDKSAQWLADRLFRLFMQELETMKKRSPVEAIILKWVGLRYGKERRKYIFGSLERIFKLSFAINYRDIEVVNLPRHLSLFYYLVRPFRLMCFYRQNLIKFMFK
jgi:Uncharacterised nucleotidyltransferase